MQMGIWLAIRTECLQYLLLSTHCLKGQLPNTLSACRLCQHLFFEMLMHADWIYTHTRTHTHSCSSESCGLEAGGLWRFLFTVQSWLSFLSSISICLSFLCLSLPLSSLLSTSFHRCWCSTPCLSLFPFCSAVFRIQFSCFCPLPTRLSLNSACMCGCVFASVHVFHQKKKQFCCFTNL